MASFGILSMLNRLICAVLAGLGSVAADWLPQVERLDRTELT